MKKFGEIKVILFDIDDTLFPSTKFSSLARTNAIRAMLASGLKAKNSEALDSLLKIIRKYGSNYSLHFNRLVQKFDCENKDYCIAAGVWAYHSTKDSICPFDGVGEVLDSLAKKGYILCVASAGFGVKQWDKLIRLGLDASFEHVFITKPGSKNKNFYAGICKKLNLQPSEILMVGDNEVDDILNAKKAGLRTIRVIGLSKNKKSLSADANLVSIANLGSILS